MLAWSHPFNLKKLKLLTAEISNRCTKILVKWQLIKMDCDRKQLFLKTFFLCSLLCLITENSFFSIVQYFSIFFSSMNTVFILEEHLQPWINYIKCIWQIFYLRHIVISKEHLQSDIWIVPSLFQDATCGDLVFSSVLCFF